MPPPKKPLRVADAEGDEATTVVYEFRNGTGGGGDGPAFVTPERPSQGEVSIDLGPPLLRGGGGAPARPKAPTPKVKVKPIRTTQADPADAAEPGLRPPYRIGLPGGHLP